jgi:enoyl-CoA hydratase/carnithine racemase
MSARPLREFVLTGRRFSAEEARSSGLVTDVVDLDALDARVETLVDELRATDPSAVGRAKKLLTELPELSVRDGYELVSRTSAAQFASPTARAAQREFVEGRAAADRLGGT